MTTKSSEHANTTTKTIRHKLPKGPMSVKVYNQTDDTGGNDQEAAYVGRVLGRSLSFDFAT